MFPVQILSVIFLLCLSTADADIQLRSGVPLPHATELEAMIRTHIFPNKKDNETFMDYFERNDMDVDNDALILLENMDFSVLDTDGLRNVLKLVKLRELKNATIQSRRQGQRRAKWQDKYAIWDRNATHIVNKTMDLMKQSIYSTRYMIEKTKPIRKMYRTDFVYQMGIMYGYMLELRWKADNCLATMAKFNHKIFKFARYLWLYERVLSIHVDFTDALQRIFMLHDEIHKPSTETVTTTESSEETT